MGKKGRIAYNSGIAGNSSESAITFPTPPFLEELGLGSGPVWTPEDARLLGSEVRNIQ